ncbi:MAG TPA: hypothetical protein PLD20_20420 [Blastocatellia bacterium]|nr:hypothetical protein [Blastocatellia bacterium]HMZ20313.1 hypothetical protein [Blastocatellia bacterium]HNG29719.1 hypothetical protein [Blastocatellia bacterium]
MLPDDETAAIGTLPIPMIESSGQAALMALPGGAPLLGTRLRTTSGAAITLTAITSAADKEARTTRGGATKALAKSLRRGMHQHHSRLHEIDNGCAGMALSRQDD